MTAADVVARGERVIVRRKRVSDAPDDYRWRCDPEVTRYDGAEPLQMTYTDFVGLHTAELSYADNRRQVFAVDTVDGRHIGNLMFYNASPSTGQAELGVSVGDEADRGRGLGTEALVVFVEFLWSAHLFRRLVMHTLEWNVRARASFERAGFAVEARVMRGSEALIRMAATREGWTRDRDAFADGSASAGGKHGAATGL